MSLTGFIILLLIAGLCGAAGQAIAGYTHGGCLASIGLGFVGALLGMFIARALKLPELYTVNIGGEASFPIIWSILGATLFVALISIIQRRRTYV